MILVLQIIIYLYQRFNRSGNLEFFKKFLHASTLKIQLNPYFNNLSSAHVDYILGKDKLTEKIFGRSFMSPKTKKAYKATLDYKLPEDKH